MNQNYETYLLQKCMIAVAFAIIKSKPTGRSLEEYINDVKNKLDHREDSFEDVSISESDFANCDDEMNGVDNSKNETEAIVPENNSSHKDFRKLDNNFGAQAHSNDTNEHNGPVKSVNRNQIESTSVVVDNNTEDNHCHELAKTTSIQEVLDIFKDIDKISENKMFISTSTPKNARAHFAQENKSQTSLTKVPNVDSEITFCSFGDRDTDRIDTQDTDLYIVHGYTDHYTHISQSQDVDNIVVPNKFIQNRHSNIDVGYNKINGKLERVSNSRSSTIFTNENEISRTEDIFYESYNNVKEFNKITISQKSVSSNSRRTNEVVDAKTKKLKLSNNSVTKSSDEYNYMLNDMSENNHQINTGERGERNRNNSTFSSTSLFNDLETNSNSILSGNKPKERLLEDQHKIQNVETKSTFSRTSLLSELELDSNSLVGCSQPRELLSKHHNKIQYVEFDNAATVNVKKNVNVSDNNFVFSPTDSDIQYKTDLSNDNTRCDDTEGNDINAKNNGPLSANCKCGQLSSGYETQCPSRNLVLDSPNEIEEKSDAEASQEIVSFKILEELSRVKNYLHRQDRLSDSGRSSQGSQLSVARINESGYCLLNYLVECPLIERTLDITEEVSRVLGELVEKLHDDENYPQFVEKILSNVQELVSDIYEGERTEDLFKKEEQINRLLLLNRSVNVNKFTIEKMLPILQEVHLRLQKKDLLELDLVRTENLCYILHTLEVLLKRYNAAASSQASTQPSQEDEKSLRRSTITEIWRKRWNLSKTDVSEGSFKKKCVLSQISEVLNKMIVEGMEGYSLISFAVLQCFNLLQS